MQNHSLLISVDAFLHDKMLTVNDKQVLTENDLATLFNITTNLLLKKVKANIRRFPPDFLIEFKDSAQKCKYAFSWGGIMQAASILHTTRAVDLHLQLIRCYVKEAGVFDKLI
jgi:hypothetical protein